MRSLSADDIRPCSKPEAQPGQLARRQPLVGLLRRGDLQLLALLDERADDVRLAARRHLARTRRPRLGLEQRSGRPAGHDRRAARRQLVEHADVEIAVHRHRRRARDRRRRHHQHVGHRRPGLVAQRRPLLDAEAVLLVDHHDAEAVELDALLDQRVRADHEVDRSVGQPGEHAPPLGAGDPVGEQLDRQRPLAEQVAGGHEQPVEHLAHGRRRAARRAPRSAPSARPGDRPGRRRAAPSRRRPSCPTRRRPGAAGASGAAGRGRSRSRRSPGAAPPSAGTADRSWNRATSSPPGSWRMPTDSRSIARLRMTRASCTRSSSSKASRRRACSLSAIDSGTWMSCSAAPRSISPSRRRTAAGTGSAKPLGAARSSAFSTQPASSHVVSWTFSLCG